MDGRWASAGRRGVHDSAVDLTSGAVAGVRAPSGGQMSRWASTTASSTLNQNSRSSTDRATLVMNNFQT
jgi:hypothetical protein